MLTTSPPTFQIEKNEDDENENEEEEASENFLCIKTYSYFCSHVTRESNEFKERT